MAYSAGTIICLCASQDKARQGIVHKRDEAPVYAAKRVINAGSADRDGGVVSARCLVEGARETLHVRRILPPIDENWPIGENDGGIVAGALPAAPLFVALLLAGPGSRYLQVTCGESSSEDTSVFRPP